MHIRFAPFVQALFFACALLVASPLIAQTTAGCWFSDLRWSDDGGSLLFLAGDEQQVRTLRYDLESGSLTCIDPRAADPVWGSASGRVLFRDQFGVFEARVDGEQPPRMILFLPEVSQHFLRDFGEDNRGQPMAWTYDRRAARHSILTVAPDGMFALPGAMTGGEARRAWQERNEARRFTDVGGMFVRSACYQRPRRKDQICFESISDGSRRSPFFRITMGPPGGVEVVQNRCAPSALSQSRDSTRVILGVYEEVDRQGQSEVLSCWVSDWQEARRVTETLLPSLLDVRLRQNSSAYWLNSRQVLWADAIGQLMTVNVDSATAVPLVSVVSPALRSPMHRVVIGVADDLEAAESLRADLEHNGLDVGIKAATRGYEVQVGAWSDRNQALQRADYLQRNGYPSAHVREGGVDKVATDMGFEWLPRGSGDGVFLRQVQGAQGTFAELWWASQSQEPQRLIPSFEEFSPAAVQQ